MRVIYDIKTGQTIVDQNWQPEPETLPPPPVPASITRRQMRLWLVRHGYTLAQVEALIDALPEPQRMEARIEWQDATQFERAHPLLRQLAGQLLRLDKEALDEALDAAFRQAAGF
jgi:DNA-binding transcriptional MerR regulator